MKVEYKTCSGSFIELDGVPVHPTPETKGRGIEDKAVWPQHSAKHPSGDPSPGDSSYLEARQVAAKVRDMYQWLESLRQERKKPVPADHPVVQRALRLLSIRVGRAR